MSEGHTCVTAHTWSPEDTAGDSSPLLSHEFRGWTRADRLCHLYPLSQLAGPRVLLFKPTSSSASQGIPSLIQELQQLRLKLGVDRTSLP